MYAGRGVYACLFVGQSVCLSPQYPANTWKSPAERSATTFHVAQSLAGSACSLSLSTRHLRSLQTVCLGEGSHGINRFHATTPLEIKVSRMQKGKDEYDDNSTPTERADQGLIVRRSAWPHATITGEQQIPRSTQAKHTTATQPSPGTTAQQVLRHCPILA